MGDTREEGFPKERCSDCGKIGCCVEHWGSFVVPGEKGFFCWFCWFMRQSTNKGKELGVKPPMESEDLRHFTLKVTTLDGSVYDLKKPNKKGLRGVSCSKYDFGYNLCKILLLEEGRSLCFWEHNTENDSKGWSSSVVVKIEKF